MDLSSFPFLSSFWREFGAVCSMKSRKCRSAFPFGIAMVDQENRTWKICHSGEKKSPFILLNWWKGIKISGGIFIPLLKFKREKNKSEKLAATN